MAGKPKTISADSSVVSEVADAADAVDALAEKLFVRHWRMTSTPQYETGHLADKCLEAAESFLAHAAARREAVAST